MASPPTKKKVFIKTFGCQMNDYDSGKMQALLQHDGFESCDEAADADLVLVNTCSVREKPEHKLHSFIGEVKHLRKRGTRIGIAGCMAQHDGERLFAKYHKDVDLVFGPDQVPRIRDLVARSASERVLDNSFMDRDDYPFVTEVQPTFKGRITAFVTIQKGCDNKCTFCIVPQTRGVEVSRPSGQIVDEVRACVEAGAKEITLLGQNVNSYGLKRGEVPFAELLHRVADVPGVVRIRYTSPHPRDMGDDVVEAHRTIPQLAEHIHLPVQSGSNTVLRRMKRFYTRERYLELAAALREARPGLQLTTDVIAGFPGETDADFDDTMSLLEDVGFAGSFSFKYNRRPGTAALRLPEGDEVAEDVKQARLVRFQGRQRELQQAQNAALVGEVVEVLVEGPSKWDDSVVCGRTGSFRMVNFAGPVSLVGQLVRVRILRGFVNSLRGELVDA